MISSRVATRLTATRALSRRVAPTRACRRFQSSVPPPNAPQQSSTNYGMIFAAGLAGGMPIIAILCGFYQVSKLKKLIDKPESPLEYLKRFKDDMTMVMQKHSDDATEFAWETFRNFHNAVEERFRKPRQSGEAGKEEHDSKTSKSS